MRLHTLVAAALAALATPAAATAQLPSLAVGAGVSTLGLGANASVRVAGPLAVRVGLNAVKVTLDDAIDTDIAYEAKPNLFTVPVVAELHPFGGAFHLAGGLVRNRNKVELLARNTGTITIDGQTYTQDEVESLEGRIGFERKWAPYAGLGFDGSVFGRGRVHFFFDLGVIFQGEPTTSLRVNSTLTGAEREQLDAGVQAAEDEVQAEIDDAGEWKKYYPVLGLGLKIRL